MWVRTRQECPTYDTYCLADPKGRHTGAAEADCPSILAEIIESGHGIREVFTWPHIEIHWLPNVELSGKQPETGKSQSAACNVDRRT